MITASPSWPDDAGSPSQPSSKSGKAFTVSNFLNGVLHTYYYAGQTPYSGLKYDNPTEWAKAGTMLRPPRCVIVSLNYGLLLATHQIEMTIYRTVNSGYFQNSGWTYTSTPTDFIILGYNYFLTVHPWKSELQNGADPKNVSTLIPSTLTYHKIYGPPRDSYDQINDANTNNFDLSQETMIFHDHPLRSSYIKIKEKLLEMLEQIVLDPIFGLNPIKAILVDYSLVQINKEDLSPRVDRDFFYGLEIIQLVRNLESVERRQIKDMMLGQPVEQEETDARIYSEILVPAADDDFIGTNFFHVHVGLPVTIPFLSVFDHVDEKIVGLSQEHAEDRIAHNDAVKKIRRFLRYQSVYYGLGQVNDPERFVIPSLPGSMASYYDTDGYQRVTGEYPNYILDVQPDNFVPGFGSIPNLYIRDQAFYDDSFSRKVFTNPARLLINTLLQEEADGLKAATEANKVGQDYYGSLFLYAGLPDEFDGDMIQQLIKQKWPIIPKGSFNARTS